MNPKEQYLNILDSLEKSPKWENLDANEYESYFALLYRCDLELAIWYNDIQVNIALREKQDILFSGIVSNYEELHNFIVNYFETEVVKHLGKIEKANQMLANFSRT